AIRRSTVEKSDHRIACKATGALTRSGITIRGEVHYPAWFDRATTCVQSKDSNHDAVVHIGSEAEKRRTHSSSRHESQVVCRDSGVFSVLRSLCRAFHWWLRHNRANSAKLSGCARGPARGYCSFIVADLH